MPVLPSLDVVTISLFLAFLDSSRSTDEPLSSRDRSKACAFSPQSMSPVSQSDAQALSSDRYGHST